MKTCGVVGKYDQIVNTFVNKATPMEVEMCPPDPDIAVNPTFSDKETMEVEMCLPDLDIAVNPTFIDKETPMELEMCPPDSDHAVKPTIERIAGIKLMRLVSERSSMPS